MATITGASDAAPPSPEEIRLADEGSQALAPLLSTDATSLRLRIAAEDGAETIVALPVSALRLLQRTLDQMSRGNAVEVVSLPSELTTQQAADLLRVSRPFLIGLLEKGEIPYRLVGSHRRVLLRDVVEYKRRIDGARRQTLRELAAHDQAFGFDA